MLQLSRAARRPLQGRPPWAPSRIGSGPFSSPRQFSHLSQTPSGAHRSPQRPSWTGIYTSPRFHNGLRISAVPSVRYASTDATTPPDTPSDSFADFVDIKAQATEHSSSIVDRWLPSVPELQTTIAYPPDTMGYLYALGLDNGWGPTTMMQAVVEGIHVFSGAPWWATTVLTAVALRLAFLPVFMRVSDNGARIKAVQPHIIPFVERQRAALLNQDLMAQQQIRAELFAVYKRAGINPLVSFATLIQVPFQFGSFFILRQIAYLPVPGLEHAGILWFTDLTSADPYFILPVLSAALMHASLRLGAVDLPSASSGKTMKYISYILPGLSLAVTATMPSILTLYFAASAVLSFIQAFALRDNTIRARLKIYPLGQPTELAVPLRQNNLSGDALAKIEADQNIIRAQQEKLSQQSSGNGMMSMALGSKGGLTSGIKDSLNKRKEEARYKEYEKKAKEMDEAKRRAGRR